MNSKLIVLMTLLVLAACQSQVTLTEKCKDCGSVKSQADCAVFGGCTWTPGSGTTAGSCAKAPEVVVNFTAYCPGLADLTKCAQTNGCAYLDSKCTHFAGCTAYVKTTTADCQAISTNCVSLDGVTCSDALTCDKYSAAQCPSNPDLNGRKCTVDTTSGLCRNYTCAESDQTYTTPASCTALAAGCVTTGAGCVASLVTCAELVGNETTCPLMKGKDGKCKFVSGTNCALKLCTDATATAKDEDCQAFQDGCVSTGKGCIATLGACQTYTVTTPANAATECSGYVGTDGVCEGDAGSSTCRGRKCENSNGTTLTACISYKKGCLTNQKQCVTSLGKCSEYTGKTSDCLGIRGSDGNCTGSSTTTSGSCKLKDCAADSTPATSFTQDSQCKTIQDYCVTTGLGCVATLLSCTTYTAALEDGSDCKNRIGQEGKCKYSGSGKACAPRVCTEATSEFLSATGCANYFTNCVYNGTQCVTQSTCQNTIKQSACLGTTENSAKCNWNPICVNQTDCSNFITQALCAANSAQVTSKGVTTKSPCIWANNGCRAQLCSDYSGDNYKTNEACDGALTGCVTNGTGCADPNQCGQFKGNMTTCQAYKAYCTNTDDTVAATTPCISRTCGNAAKTIKQDIDCQTYLPSCLTNGAGCVDKTATCSGYTGLQADCATFSGYVDDTTRIKCWTTTTSGSPVSCQNISCKLASGMKDNNDCGQFLTGCIYDGDGSCVLPDAQCSDYGYPNGSEPICQGFSGKNGDGTIKCWQGSSNNCRNRSCSDYASYSDKKANPSNSDCDSFLTGCLSNGLTCLTPSAPCTSYSGSVDVCNTYIGNQIQCTKIETCKVRVCSEKNSGVTDNTVCTTYHKKCRKIVLDGTACADAQSSCTGYTFGSSNIASDKQNYCSSITTSSKGNCAWDTTSTNCVARTACTQWVTGITTATCADYMGTNTCVKNTTDNKCYAVGACTSYVVPTGQTAATWCGTITDATLTTCSYTSGPNCSGAATPAAPTTCEGITTPTSAAGCNTTLGSVTCQFYNNKCYTTQTACTLYSLTGISSNQANYCTALNANNAGVVTQCKYDSGTSTNCVAMTCADITSPTKQSHCNVVSGCKYNSSACYAPAACSSYTFTASTDAADRLKCQNYVNNTGAYCSFTSGTTCSDPITDCGSITGNSLAICGLYRLGTGQACHWSSTSSTKCEAPVTDVCAAVTSINTSNSCDLYTTVVICKNNAGNCEINAACSAQNYSTSTSADTKSADCQNFKDGSGLYCSWKVAGTGNACAIAPDTCANWDSLTTTVDNTTFCEARIDKTGTKCTYDIGAAACRASLACEYATSPGSQTDCDVLSTGCTYFSGSCYIPNANCNTYTAVGTLEGDKLNYCNAIKTNTNTACTFIKGTTYCVNKGACNTYNVSTASGDKSVACKDISTTDSKGCTYWNSGSTCIAKAACSTYTVTTAANLATPCAAQVDNNGLICFGGATSTACSLTASCEAITGATGQVDCDKYLTGCLYFNIGTNKCYTASTTCAYTAPAADSINFCGNLKNSSTGEKCTAASATATVCIDRTCADTGIATPTSNNNCAAYKSSCKSDGTKCIEGSLACDSVTPTSNCSSILDSDNSSGCDSYPTTCIDKSCDLNKTANSDPDCDLFSKGCKTKGTGCISPTATCSQYSGTIADCLKFVGSDGKCYGASETVSGACKLKQCSDNKTAKQNSDCESFLSGCLANGGGCIASTEPCSSYKGNNDICSGFVGSSGNSKCWGQSATSTTGQCRNRICTDKLSASDSECASFIPSSDATKPNCVSNGTKCVPASTQCKDFTGTVDTCPTFKASDQPCKATTQAASGGSCAVRVCTEAPNSYTTDVQCKSYHGTCVTTGRGCVAASSFNCKYVQTQAACGANTSCVWANQCRSAPATCNTLTDKGQSICTNTLLSNGKKCAWNIDTCREFTCADYDATITTHKVCNDLDPKCTTSGAGCVIYSTCNTYTVASVCSAAYTTETSIQCTWDKLTTKCRQRQCTDNTTATSDNDCNTFLAGCKTTGTGCVGGTYSCDVFSGNQKYCLKNSSGTPCLYLNGTCYDYAQCGDAKASSLTGCQQFNQLCVLSTANTCLAQRSCDKYEQAVECVVGINNTKCGWLPTGKCQVFTACTDASSTSDSACLTYGSNCLSDGTNCITKGACSSYLTQAACTSTVGATDGQCTWVPSGTSGSCRLAICTDKIAITDQDCAAFIVTAGICTTDGTTCVARSTCTSYVVTETNQAACTIGSDGIQCIYGYALGQTTGAKSCRPKDCSDVTGTTNDLCTGQVTGKKCVSNGKNCIAQDKCSTYTNKIACNGGGTDGICAFTSIPTKTDSYAGTCALFNSCDVAKNDQNVCNSNPSCLYNSTITGNTTTTSCNTKTCTKLSVSSCNNIPSYDAKKLTICTVQNGTCTTVDPTSLPSTSCYKSTAYTYTWSESTSKCVACNGSITTTNNSTNGNTTNSTNTTTDTNGYILGVTIPIVILGLFA